MYLKYIFFENNVYLRLNQRTRRATRKTLMKKKIFARGVNIPFKKFSPRASLQIPIDQVISSKFAKRSARAETLKWMIRTAKMEITPFYWISILKCSLLKNDDEICIIPAVRNPTKIGFRMKPPVYQ